MKYKNYFRLLLLIFLLKSNISSACGGYIGDHWNFYSSILDGNIMSDETLLYFVSSSSSETQNLPESHQNIDLWIEYLGGHLPYDDVEEVVYDMTTRDLAAISQYLPSYNETNTGTLKLSNRVKSNKMVQYLLDNDKLEEVVYLLLAKDFAEASSEMLVEWQWNNGEQVYSDELQSDIDRAVKFYESYNSEFLKERLAFQIMRLLSNAGQFESSTEFYDEFASNMSIKPNLITGWIHGLLGRNYFYSKQPKKAAYQWVKLYELSPEKYVPAAQSLLWTDLDYDEVLDQCNTAAEKRALADLYSTSPKAWNNFDIRRVLLAEPNSDILEMLGMLTFKQYEKDNNQRGLKSLLESCQKIAKTTEASRQPYWNALATASALLTDNEDVSKKLIDQWADNSGYDLTMSNQWNVLKLVHDSKYGRKKQMETDAFSVLPSLVSETDQEGWSQYLCNKYMFEGYQRLDDSVGMFAAMLNSAWLEMDERSKRRAPIVRFGTIYWNDVTAYLEVCSDDVLLQVVDYLRTDDNDAFSFYYTGMLKPDVILDFAMTRAASQLDWQRAISFGNQIQSSSFVAKQKLLVDPFTSFYDEIKYTSNKYSGELGRYTKKEAIELMRKTKLKADLGDKSAAYDYATALYNSSFYGNNWLLTRYAWSSYDEHLYFHENEIDMNSFGDEYFELEEAEKYAVLASSQSELKDDANFLAALCVQHRVIRDMQPYSSNYMKIYANKSLDNKYFANISTQNSDLESFCSYYNRYLNNSR